MALPYVANESFMPPVDVQQPETETEKTKKFSFPVWAIIALVVVVVIIAVTISIIVMRRKPKRDRRVHFRPEDEDNPEDEEMPPLRVRPRPTGEKLGDPTFIPPDAIPVPQPKTRPDEARHTSLVEDAKAASSHFGGSIPAFGGQQTQAFTTQNDGSQREKFSPTVGTQPPSRTEKERAVDAAFYGDDSDEDD